MNFEWTLTTLILKLKYGCLTDNMKVAKLKKSHDASFQSFNFVKTFLVKKTHRNKTIMYYVVKDKTCINF